MHWIIILCFGCTTINLSACIFHINQTTNEQKNVPDLMKYAYPRRDCNNSHIRFFIMDFEFAPINRVDILLISGAVSNSLDKYTPKKLEGAPLILMKTNEVQVFNKKRIHEVEREVKRLYIKKKSALIPLVLAQLKQSISINKTKEGKSLSTLSTVYLMDYLHVQGKVPIIVFWSGATDFTIVQRLKLRGIHKILNIRSNRNFITNTFHLHLFNMHTKEKYHTMNIGYVEKVGAMLKLTETHDVMCNSSHNITHWHDPVTDVILTKCIFNLLIKNMTPKKLYNLM